VHPLFDPKFLGCPTLLMVDMIHRDLRNIRVDPRGHALFLPRKVRARTIVVPLAVKERPTSNGIDL
jgi:hypothetical protein